MADFLDARQRAMLAEMGVTVWHLASDSPAETQGMAAREKGVAATAPERERGSLVNGPGAAIDKAVATSTSTNKSGSPATDSRHNRGQHEPLPPAAPVASTEWADVSSLDWPQLREAANTCRDCGLCAERQATVWGDFLGVTNAFTPLPGRLVLVITDPPDEADEAARMPLGGDQSAAGSLLDAMLQAAGWLSGDPSTRVFLTPVTKCKVPAGYKLTNTELMACGRYLAQQIQLLKPQLILTLGRVAAQALLAPSQEGRPAQALGQLRGKVHEVQGHAMVASLAPQYLLRNPLEKAKAWDDLCLALSHLAKTSAT